MSDIQRSVIPVLNDTQKNQVLLIQRQILTAQVNIYNSQKQMEQLAQGLNSLLTSIAQELKIDPNAYTFDLDRLVLIEKELPPVPEDIGRAS